MSQSNSFWRPKKSTMALVISAIATLSLSQYAFAQDPIQTRQGLMKTVGASMKASGAMAKGQMPYDPAKAELAMRAIAAVGLGIGQYFPNNSKTGGKTTASPKIWEDMNGFKAALAKFSADANAGRSSCKIG